MFENFRKMIESLVDRNVKRELPSSKTKIIALANQKGGCGKTTTAINLSAALSKKGVNILLIDLDPQSHATLGLGIDNENLRYSVHDVLVRGLELERATLSTYLKGLDICPAVPMLTGTQLEIANLVGRESILSLAIHKMLNTHNRSYDYIIIDTSPSLNLLTLNGLVAAGLVLVPIQTHYFSLEGMKELFMTINIVKERLNPRLELLGIVATLYDGRTNMSKNILKEIREYFNEKAFSTVIPINIKLCEASAQKKSIFDYAPNTKAAKNYMVLADEVWALTQDASLVLPPSLALEKISDGITAP
jgi:chromosome partitioning protein